MTEKQFNIHDELIKRCQRNDPEAQKQVYELYASAMYHVCVRLTGNSTIAEDLLQEIFIKIFNRINRFRGEGSLGVWIKRVTINHCLDFLRKKRPFMVELEQASPAEIEDDWTEETGISPDMIHESIKELPDGCRIVLVLHLFEKAKHREIAKQLGISESTSKSQYQRALRLLRKKLIPLAYEEQV